MTRSAALISTWLVLGLAACTPGAVGQSGNQTRGTTAGGGGGGGTYSQAYANAIEQAITWAKANTSCSTLSTTGSRDRAFELYRSLFGNETVEFAWQPASRDYEAYARRVYFPPLQSLDGANALMDFSPCSGRGTEPNETIFNAVSAAPEVYRRFNPRDWQTSVFLKYGSSGTNWLAVNNFFGHLGCRDVVQDNLRHCARVPGGCDGSIVMLSSNDLGKLFETRFVRRRGTTVEQSRIFRLINIDASGHHLQHYTCYEATPGAGDWVNGCNHQWLDLPLSRAKTRYRGEIPERFYNQLQAQNAFNGGADMLLRLSYKSDYGCGAGPRPADVGTAAPGPGGGVATADVPLPNTTAAGGGGGDGTGADTPDTDPPEAGGGAGDDVVNADEPTCAAISRQRGWASYACERDGNNACAVPDGMAPWPEAPSFDCVRCCAGPPNEDGIGRGAAVSVTNDPTTIPDGTPTPPPPGTPEATGTFRSHNTINLNIRAAANTGAQVLGSIPPGICVEKLGEANGWWNVRYNGIVGWSSTGNGAWLNQTTPCN